jgi:hypothetical protein
VVSFLSVKHTCLDGYCTSGYETKTENSDALSNETFRSSRKQDMSLHDKAIGKAIRCRHESSRSIDAGSETSAFELVLWHITYN